MTLRAALTKLLVALCGALLVACVSNPTPHPGTGDNASNDGLLSRDASSSPGADSGALGGGDFTGATDASAAGHDMAGGPAADDDATKAEDDAGPTDIEDDDTVPDDVSGPGSADMGDPGPAADR